MLRYVALGDSTTEGLQDPDGQGGYVGWADRLAGHLKAAHGGVAYANLALRGLRASEIRTRQLRSALAFRPQVASVVGGVNDFLRPRFDADVVAAEVRFMIAALRATGARVITFTMPDMTPVNPLAALIRGRLVALNERLRRTCRDTGALLLDLEHTPVSRDPRLWAEDRLHPSTAGHERIAAGLAWVLGLTGFDDWAREIVEAPEKSLSDRVRRELAWSTRWFLPWVVRHAVGRSSSHGRAAKRPELRPL